jgi:hypothetical protein
MALTGHLSDLSLSELIEFFCNQRKSGRLKVLYPKGAGYFYLQAGSVVDARIGVLQGIDAVYYALTLPNAEFEFSVDAETTQRTINQPWTQVVLEGLRRLDENIAPSMAFPPDYVHTADEVNVESNEVESKSEVHKSFNPFTSIDSGGNRKPFYIGAAVVAVVVSVAAIGVPAGWYKRAQPAPVAAATVAETPTPQAVPAEVPQAQSEPQETPTDDAAALAAKRQREKERKAREAKEKADSASANPTAPTPPVTTEPKSNAKRVVVTVSYDESGRVTQASGGDPTAIRIARQKRFPPGKAGSATVSIPIN